MNYNQLRQTCILNKLFTFEQSVLNYIKKTNSHLHTSNLDWNNISTNHVLYICLSNNQKQLLLRTILLDLLLHQKVIILNGKLKTKIVNLFVPIILKTTFYKLNTAKILVENKFINTLDYYHTNILSSKLQLHWIYLIKSKLIKMFLVNQNKLIINEIYFKYIDHYELSNLINFHVQQLFSNQLNLIRNL